MKLRRFVAIALAATLAPPGWPVPSPVLAQAPNPCTAALAADLQAATPMRKAAGRETKYGPLGADQRDVRDLLQRSLSSAQAQRVTTTAASVQPLSDRDENNIAILEDRNGDLIIPANRFDLVNVGIRFEPAGAGYAVTGTGAAFRGQLGRRLSLSDDESSTSQTIAFPF